MNTQHSLESEMETEPPLLDTTNEPLESNNDSINEESKIWSRLPQLLRWIGGLSLAGSAITFLLGGWMDAEPLMRFYSFFGLTAILSAAGLLCATKLNEDKGARTFLSLGASFVPVLACQLGALIFAKASGHTSNFGGGFELFEFNPIGLPILIGTATISLITLPFISYLGFSSMARVEAKRLSICFAVSNFLLLIPTRDTTLITAIGFLLLATITFLDIKIFSKPSAMRTWEGRAMRSLLFAPFGLLTLRSILLHRADAPLFGLVFASLFALFFFALPKATHRLWLKQSYQILSLPPLLLAWTALASPLLDLRFERLNSLICFAFLPFAIIVTILSLHCVGKGRFFRFFAGALGMLVATSQLVNYGGFLPSFISLVVSIGVVTLAYSFQEKWVLATGLIGLAISLFYHVGFAVDLYNSYLWLSLAITGVLVIIAASYAERHWRDIIHGGHALRAKFSKWN